MRLWIITIFTFLVFSGVSSRNTSSDNDIIPLIYAGYEAFIEDYSYAVFLHIEETKPRSCGGSLIFVQTILTAAHCVDEIENKQGMIRAYFGSTIPRDATVTRIVIGYEIAPRYQPRTGNNNIAVLFLDSPVPLGHTIKKIVLDLKQPAVGTLMYSVGWGKQQVNRPYKLPDFSLYRGLRATKQVLLSRADCQKNIGNEISNAICTKPIMGHLHKDDVGNGLILKRPDGVVTLVGIVSYIANGISYYVNVGSNRKWIEGASWRIYNKVCHGRDV